MKKAMVVILGLIVLFAVAVLVYTHSPRVRAQIMYGGDLDRSDIGGWTPLHSAAAAGDLPLIDYLLARGLDKNARTGRGETAWHIATLHRRSAAATHLEGLGVDSGAPRFPGISRPYMGQSPPGDIPDIFMPGIVSGHYPAHSPVVFSPDLREAYWTAGLPPHGCVERMVLEGRRWSYPEMLAMKGEPSFSPDGRKLFFISTDPLRVGEAGGKENIWVMARTDSGWSDPHPLGDGVNSRNIHFHHSVDAAGNLYFSDYNTLFYSAYRDGEYQDAVDLAEFRGNQTLKGHSPHISPDGSFLLFAAGKGLRGVELCVSFRRPDGSWTDRASLGDEVNAGRLNDSPRLTPDGNYVFFVSTGNSRPWGIYWVAARVIDRVRSEQLDWAPPPPDASAPPGTPPRIDGVFAPGEWDDAEVIDLGATKKIFLKHDGTNLYFGFNANGGNLYFSKDGSVHILHASYSLGQAEYIPDPAGGWSCVKEYEWQLFGLQEKTDAEVDAGLNRYLTEHGWTGSLIPMGDPYQAEFAVSLAWLGIDHPGEGGMPRLGTSHMSAPRWNRPVWPVNIVLSDSLDSGYTPEQVHFNVSAWGEIRIRPGEQMRLRGSFNRNAH